MIVGFWLTFRNLFPMSGTSIDNSTATCRRAIRWPLGREVVEGEEEEDAEAAAATTTTTTDPRFHSRDDATSRAVAVGTDEIIEIVGMDESMRSDRAATNQELTTDDLATTRIGKGDTIREKGIIERSHVGERKWTTLESDTTGMEAKGDQGMVGREAIPTTTTVIVATKSDTIQRKRNENVDERAGAMIRMIVIGITNACAKKSVPTDDATTVMKAMILE